jgi:hypothetical protein
LASSSPIYGTTLGQFSGKQFSPFMETARFEVEPPRSKLEAVRTKNQRLPIELGNSESEKEFFRQEV